MNREPTTFLTVNFPPNGLHKICKNVKNQTKSNKGCVRCGLAIYIIKKYLKVKEELWKLKYFTLQKYSLQKIL
jgi:hypothetical protein